MVRVLVATPVIVFMLLAAVGGLTGRFRPRACCVPPAGSRQASAGSAGKVSVQPSKTESNPRS
jgi:hypothetical protein